MKYFARLLWSVIFIAGCNTTYLPQLLENKSYSTPHKSSQEAVLVRTKQVLQEEGYQILYGDILAGHVSTGQKNIKLKPGQADCGNFMSFDYLDDDRTTTEVAFEVIVNDTTLTIRSNIQGKFRSGLLDEERTITCFSSGVIEENLAKKILGAPASEQR